VDVDLFIKKMPQVVKELISREAFDNRRSINQETIALLEEALVNRVGAASGKRKQIEALLSDYADSRNAADARKSGASLNHFSGGAQGSAA
jgi:hypothetical protein